MKHFAITVFVVAFLVGYVANIIKLFSETTFGWIAGRVVGIFIPFIGAIAGYF
mgnify:CR=1 FL=1